MLGKREESSKIRGVKEFSQESKEELDRIYQLHQKRRPWTTNFKVFLEKELGLQIGQGLVDSKDDERFEMEPKYKELLELFNKKQARLASEVVGEDNTQSVSNTKLDITNASTVAEDSQNGFFVTPVKPEDRVGLSQYEKLLAETMNSIVNSQAREAHPAADQTSDERRNDMKMEVEPIKIGNNLQFEIPVELPSPASESMGWQEEQPNDQIDEAHQEGSRLFVSDLQIAEPSTEEINRFKRMSSFDMLSDTDLEGFIFEKEDYCKISCYPVDGVRKLLVQDGFNALYL